MVGEWLRVLFAPLASVPLALVVRGHGALQGVGADQLAAVVGLLADLLAKAPREQLVQPQHRPPRFDERLLEGSTALP